MGKNKFWQKSFNASDIDFILKKIKSQRHVSDDGKVSFSGSWGFEGLFSIVSSAIPESEITEAAKSGVIKSLLFSKRLNKDFSEKEFIANFCFFKNIHMRNESRFYRVVFPIWNKPRFLSGKTKLDHGVVDFNPNEDSAFYKRIIKERRKQHEHNEFRYHFQKEILVELDSCDICIVRVKAINPADANEKASNAIYEILGIVNFIRDSGKEWRLSSRTRGTLPVSDVLIAPHTTTHFDNGKITHDGFWHENWSGPTAKLRLSDEYISSWENNYRKIRRYINKSKWRDLCQKAAIKHHKAFSNPNLEDAFLDGWKLFELVSGSQFEKSEVQINRVANVFKDSVEMRVVGKHLAFHRNSITHGHNTNTGSYEAIAFQMVQFISHFLKMFIVNGYRFHNVQEFWDFLDLPAERQERDSEYTKAIKRIEMLKKARAFRGEA